MIEDQFYALIDPVMKELGTTPDAGEEFASPPLDVLRYYRRGVRLHWLPIIGWGLSVVAVIRQPIDLTFSALGVRKLLGRVASAVDTRFPPFGPGPHPKGISLGLTTVILTPEPITANDDATLAEVVNGRPLPRQRAVPLGVIRANLGQEALSFALASGPADIYTEPAGIADALTPHFRRFVSLIDV